MPGADPRRRLRARSQILLTAVLLLLALAVGLAVTGQLSEPVDPMGQGAQRPLLPIATYLGRFARELRGAAEVFVQKHSAEIDELLSNPRDGLAFRHLQSALKSRFPGSLGIGLADNMGNPVSQGDADLLAGLHRRDIRLFLHGTESSVLYLHPEPQGYHLDVMVRLSRQGLVRGVVLVSLRTDVLTAAIRRYATAHADLVLTQQGFAELLRAGGLPTRHSLDLIFTLGRDGALRGVESVPVSGTAWDLVALSTAPLGVRHAGGAPWSAALVLVLLLAVAVLWWFLKVEERRRGDLQQALGASERLFRLLADNSPDLVALVDADGILRYVSPVSRTLLGYDPDELVGGPAQHYFYVQDPARAGQSEAVLATSPAMQDFRVRRKGFEGVWFTATGRAVRDPGSAAALAIISERRQADERLRQAGERFFKAFRAAPLSITISTRSDGRFLEINESFLEMVGYRQDEVIGHTSLELRLWHDPEQRALLLQALEEQGVVRNREVLLRAKSGEVRICLISAECIELAGESCLLVLAADITQAKRAEEALRQSEERFRLLVSNSPDTMFHQDLDLHYTWIVNPDSQFSLRDGLGKSDRDLLSARDALRLSAVKHWVLETGVGARMEIPITVGGEERFYDAAFEPRRDREGRVIGLAGYVRDITDRRRAEEKLRQTNETLQTLIRASPLAICAIDAQCKVFMWSPAAERLFGWSADEVAARPLLIIPEDRAEEARSLIAGELTGEARVALELKRRRKDGSLVDVSMWSAPLRDAGGGIVGVMAMFDDITEHKRAERRTLRLLEENRLLARRLLEIQEDERKELARELHDELGQCVTAIKADAFAIKRTIRAGTLPSEDGIEAIVAIAGRIYDVVHNMMRRLRPDIPDSLGLEGAVREYVTAWQARHPDIECSLRIAGTAGERDEATDIALYRIIQESLTNVSRHSAATLVQIRLCFFSGELRVGFGGRAAAGSIVEGVHLVVRDNGRGMDVDAPRTGFGVSGMRERAEAAGGRLTLRSGPGRGMRVSVVLPSRGSQRQIRGKDETSGGRGTS